MSSRKISSFISCASLLLGSYMPLYLVSGQLPALADPASTTAAAAPAAANPASSTAMPASATATPAAVAMPSYPDPVETLPATFKNIQKLVLQFYPKAKFDVKPTSMHFDEKCKSELGYYSGHMAMAPQAGGILCDIAVQDGQYDGKDKDRLPSEMEDGFHCELTMAPYSKHDNKHLLVKLTFPPDISVEFKENFKNLVNEFNGQELVAEAAEAKAAADAAAAKAAAEQAEQAKAAMAAREAANEPSTLSGSSRLSLLTFPEGRFKIKLPDTPATKYATQMGLRMVDYCCPEEHGSYNVSYIILPSRGNPAAANSLFDKLAAGLIQQVNGVNAKQSYTSVRNFPGRQVVVGDIKGKQNCGGLMRMYLVDNYIYVVGAVGEKAWLESPVINDYMSSFEFSCAQDYQRQDSQSNDSQRQSYQPQSDQPTDGRDAIAKHVRDAELAHKKQETADHSYRFSADVRKTLSGNGVGGQGKSWGQH
jgi:hypothetical protein